MGKVCLDYLKCNIGVHPKTLMLWEDLENSEALLNMGAATEIGHNLNLAWAPWILLMSPKKGQSLSAHCCMSLGTAEYGLRCSRADTEVCPSWPLSWPDMSMRLSARMAPVHAGLSLRHSARLPPVFLPSFPALLGHFGDRSEILLF